jgi:hypothetical protein
MLVGVPLVMSDGQWTLLEMGARLDNIGFQLTCSGWFITSEALSKRLFCHDWSLDISAVHSGSDNYYSIHAYDPDLGLGL